jgi:hypothetical protein
MTLTLHDHEEIRQLIARYNFAIDLGASADWAGCFTPDGVFECVGVPDDSPLGGRHIGHDALEAYAVMHYGIHKGRARHWNWNLLVEGDGDDARLTCYLNILSSGQGDRARLRATGTYRDTLRRVHGEWRFATRHVTIDP